MPGNKKPRKPKTGTRKGKVQKGVAKSEGWNNRQEFTQKTNKPKGDVKGSSQMRQTQKRGD